MMGSWDPKGHRNIGILDSGSKAHPRPKKRRIPEILFCKILIFIWCLVPVASDRQA